jgi:hypothetical protein
VSPCRSPEKYVLSSFELEEVPRCSGFMRCTQVVLSDTYCLLNFLNYLPFTFLMFSPRNSGSTLDLQESIIGSKTCKWGWAIYVRCRLFYGQTLAGRVAAALWAQSTSARPHFYRKTNSSICTVANNQSHKFTDRLRKVSIVMAINQWTSLPFPGITTTPACLAANPSLKSVLVC